MDMRDGLNEICDLESEVQEASDCIAVVKEIQVVLEKHELFEVGMITIQNSTWDAMFDLKRCALAELETWEMDCPEAVLTWGSLIKATVDIANLVFDQELFSRIAQDNADLQELNFSYPGRNVQYHAAHIIKKWRASPRPFRCNLLKRMHGTRGRVIAQLTMDEVGSERIQVLEWDCDQVFGPLSDFSASFLDIATKQHPTALNLFTLHVSQLVRVGLDSVQSILGRSSFEHLHVLCSPFRSAFSEAIAQVLGSVRWVTLKSLVLSGNNIDEWIKLWALFSVAPQLLCLHVQGTGSSEQELSHSSVLLLHQFVYTDSLTELHIGHIQLQDDRDWVLLVDTMDPAHLQKFSLIGSSHTQFMSSTGAADLFQSKFTKAEEDRRSLAKDYSNGVVRKLREFTMKLQQLFK